MYKLNRQLIDPILTTAVLGLISLGLVMVASSSYALAHRFTLTPFHFFANQAIRLVIGLLLAMLLMRFDLDILARHAKKILLLSFILLLVVLIPGIGKTVNGSTRWLNLIIFRLQVSEITKVACIIYLSSYLVVHYKRVSASIFGFINPMILISASIGLLMLQPDFGASVVIMLTSLGVLFLAGVSLWTFFWLLIVVAMSFSGLLIAAPYRLARLTAFLDPWANQFDSGYQLTQSLIAFGRGGWFGVGLGESMQKLLYLPEAHTDFIYAVIVEELGLLGGIAIISLYLLLFLRGMYIGAYAHSLANHFNGYLAQGITLLFSIQMLINLGVNAGVLPTKGLTLPLISYGGSSLIVSCVTLSLLFRVHIENQLQS